MTFTLQDIRDVIYDVTATPVGQMSTLECDNFINKYYTVTLPDDIKPFKLRVPYIFQTLANQVEYEFDLQKYVSLEPEFYINGNKLLYYQDQSLWLQDFQYQYNQSTIGVGDGVLTAFISPPTPTQIVPTTVIVTDGVENFTDDGLGLMTGTLGGVGNVNYVTGVVTVTFASPTPAGANVYLTYAPIFNGRPRAMYYNGNGQIQFSPIPDQAYRIEGQAYILPTAFLANGSGAQIPLIQGWGYAIAYGTCLEIFRRRGQLDQLKLYQPEYEYYLDRALSRTTEQYSNQRSLPKW